MRSWNSYYFAWGSFLFLRLLSVYFVFWVFLKGETFQLEVGLLMLLGKTYIANQNRRDAQFCLQAAVEKDPCTVEALELIQKHNLFKSREEFIALVDGYVSASFIEILLMVLFT